MFWTLNPIGWLSLRRLAIFFLELWSVLSLDHFFCLSTSVTCKGQRLRRSPGWGNPHCCAVGEGLRGSNVACSALCWFSVTSPATHKQIGPFWCWFPGGLVCVHSRTLWVSPANSPMRLGVSPTIATPTYFFSQKFWGFISVHWNPGLRGLSHSPVVPPGLSTCKCRTTWSTSCLLAVCPLHPGCSSLTLLPVWLNVSSLTPRLLDFQTVQFSGSFGCFLFLNWLLSFFWLCEEAKWFYLHLHLGQKSKRG